MTEWDNLKKNLSEYTVKWRNTNYDGAVTGMLPRTALLGNGDLGIVSSGTLQEKEYLICKGDFWNCGDMKTDCVREADARRVSPLAVGGIRIRIKDMECVGNQEELSIADGVLTTQLKGEDSLISMTAWVDQDENIFFVKLQGDKVSDRELEADLWVHGENAQFPAFAGIEEDAVWCSRRSNNEAKQQEDSWLSEVYMRGKVLNVKSETKSVTKHRSRICFTLDKGKEIYLAIAVSGGGRTYDNNGILQGELPRTQGEMLLNQVSSTVDIEKRYCENENWWKKYWLKSYIEIGDFELQRYYYGSLYYMGAGTRENKLPPGLYGIWTTTDGAMWNGDYHMNYNMIAPFYGMYSANRCEFAKSLKQPMLDYIKEGRRRAKEDLTRIFPEYMEGGKGTEESQTIFPGRKDLKEGISDAVLYPVAIGPWGSTTWNEEGAYLMQVNNAGFSAQALTAYYAYTQDEEYFREIYLFLEMNINFYLQWCEKEMTDSENYRYIIWSGAHEETFDKNAANALGVIRNILLCLFQAVENGHINPGKEKTAKWKDLYEHLSDFYMECWSDGKGFEEEVIPLSEMGAKVYSDAAPVSLEFVHPGEQLNFDSPDKLINAVKNTIRQKELLNNEIWNQVNCTPKIYTQAIRAGIAPEYVMQKFREHLQKYQQKNFTLRDGNHGIEKAGAIEFINSMLLQSANGIIKVFPVWQSERNARFVNLREKGAFIVSSEMKEGMVQYVDIVSEKGNPVNLVCPWKEAEVTDVQGKTVKVQYKTTVHTKEKTIVFETEPGMKYQVRQSQAVFR